MNEKVGEGENVKKWDPCSSTNRRRREGGVFPILRGEGRVGKDLVRGKGKGGEDRKKAKRSCFPLLRRRHMAAPLYD